MKNGLARMTTHFGDPYEKKLIDVWDVTTKKVVFTGDRKDVGVFLGIALRAVDWYIKYKSVRKKKYTLRIAKEIK